MSDEKLIYFLHDSPFINPKPVKIKAPANSCLFCIHCTDVFWDYTHGPYLTICEKDLDFVTGAKGECKCFQFDTNLKEGENYEKFKSNV